MLAEITRCGAQHHRPRRERVRDHIGVRQLPVGPQRNVDPLLYHIDDAIVRQHPQRQLGMRLQQRRQRLRQRSAADADRGGNAQLAHQRIS